MCPPVHGAPSGDAVPSLVSWPLWAGALHGGAARAGGVPTLPKPPSGLTSHLGPASHSCPTEPCRWLTPHSPMTPRPPGGPKELLNTPSTESHGKGDTGTGFPGNERGSITGGLPWLLPPSPAARDTERLRAGDAPVPSRARAAVPRAAHRARGQEPQVQPPGAGPAPR